MQVWCHQPWPPRQSQWLAQWHVLLGQWRNPSQAQWRVPTSRIPEQWCDGDTEGNGSISESTRVCVIMQWVCACMWIYQMICWYVSSMCRYVHVLPDNIHQKCASINVGMSMNVKVSVGIHTGSASMRHVCADMCMYYQALQLSTLQKCLSTSIKCRYVQVLHVFCLYLVGICRYMMTYTLKHQPANSDWDQLMMAITSRRSPVITATSGVYEKI